MLTEDTMRNLIWLIFPLFFLLIGGKTIVQLEFIANQDRIAEELCEERFEATSCCAGKCVLEKRLDALEKTSSEQPESTELIIPEIEYVSFESFCSLECLLSLNSRSEISTGPSWFATSSPIFEIENPPRIAS